jgi:peptidoglycan/LPS O-acetylase OafA/YrhL
VVLAVACACFGLAALFLRFARRRWAVADSLAEHAYAIYLVHYVFVVWLQYALLGIAIPAIAKGAIVFTSALMLSWGIAAGAGRLPWGVRLVRARLSNSGWRLALPRKMRPTG